jgi:hypothetical protein
MITPGEWYADGPVVRVGGRALAVTPPDASNGTTWHEAIDNVHLMAAAKHLLAACQATLLYHRADRWGPRQERQWRELVGEMDCTSRSLCDFVRAAMVRANQGDK